jgi:hypothetical protein
LKLKVGDQLAATSSFTNAHEIYAAAFGPNSEVAKRVAALKADSSSGTAIPALAAATEPSAVAAAEPARLALDVINVDPSGEAVLAGRAAPNVQVELRDAAKTVAEATSDVTGQFVIIPPALAPGRHSLSLATGSETSIAVLVDVPSWANVVVAPRDSSRSGDSKLTINKIDPNASVKDTLSGSGEDCRIIVQDGKNYKVCPYKVTPEIESAARSAIAPDATGSRFAAEVRLDVEACQVIWF